MHVKYPYVPFSSLCVSLCTFCIEVICFLSHWNRSESTRYIFCVEEREGEREISMVFYIYLELLLHVWFNCILSFEVLKN